MDTLTINVLLVEDNPGDVRMVREMLRVVPGIFIQSVDRLDAAIEQIRSLSWDVVLLDLGLPDSQGLGTLEALSETGCSVPVVVLTGQDDDAVGEAAVWQGAQDYLAKGYVTEQSLTHAVRYAIERKRAEEALLSEEERFRMLFETISQGVVFQDENGAISSLNPAAERILGLTLGEIRGVTSIDPRVKIIHEDGSVFSSETNPTTIALRTGQAVHNVSMGFVNPVSNSLRWLTANATPLSRPGKDSPSEVYTVFEDITERKQAWDRERLARETLDILNRISCTEDSIRDILLSIKRTMAFDAVGIRLRDGDDFPYYVTSGFDEDFVIAERYLCPHDASGQVVRDPQGKPILECICGDVLSGRTDPALPYFTPRGSFWTNGSSQLRIDTIEADRRTRIRNRCNDEGYESVALIPLMAGGTIIGLLQLNDRRPNRFTMDEIQFFEGLGASIGIALNRSRTEEALRQNEEKFAKAFMTSPYAISITSAEDGSFIDVNDRFTALSGFSREEVLANSTSGPKSWVFEADSRHVIGESGAGRAVLGQEYQFRKKDGGTITGLFSAQVIRLNGKACILSSINDISDRKRAEAEYMKLEEQLRASQKMEAIGSLAGGIAHDFNNLLCVILSYTGFLMDAMREEESERKNDLLEIKKAAERAAALTRQLLAFSRKQVLQPVPLNLNEIAAGIEKMLRRILGEDIDYVQTLASDLGIVQADPGQIEQVLMNLVVNARDAMPEGGKLTIETSNVEIDHEYAASRADVQAGPYIRLTVTDTGYGMDEATKTRIFEPFFTTKEKGKGTGLGLSTVYGIVKQSAGSVSVYSEPGVGTSFKIYLPRDLLAKQVSLGESIKGPKPIKGTETVLVVDDEEAMRQIAVRALNEAGYTTLSAANGDDALKVCGEYAGEIHLLLTDVVMPNMGGRVLSQKLAILRPAIKVLYMSGYTDEAIVHHGVLDPGTPFVGKPFTAADLKRKVREILDNAVADGRVVASMDDAAEDGAKIDGEALRALPPGFLGKLRKAVIAARYEEIVNLIETIDVSFPSVAATLRQKASVFDYEGLRGIMSRAKEEIHG